MELAKEKKELTKNQKIVKSVINWALTIICIVVIVFALVVAIFSISSSSNDGLAKFGGNVYFNVASDSMAPTFEVGDMIVSKAYDGKSDLKVGQVITFHAVINGYESYNTHRIVEVTSSGYRTRGDKKAGNWWDCLEDKTTWDSKTIAKSEIVAVWGTVDESKTPGQEGYFTEGKVRAGLGKLSLWMQDTENGGEQMKTRFFLIIVLPLIILFVAYAFILVRTLVIAKLESAKAPKGEAAVTVDALSDEEKRRLAEEYLASLKKDNDSAANDIQDETKAEDAPVESNNDSSDAQ